MQSQGYEDAIAVGLLLCLIVAGLFVGWLWVRLWRVIGPPLARGVEWLLVGCFKLLSGCLVITLVAFVGLTVLLLLLKIIAFAWQ